MKLIPAVWSPVSDDIGSGPRLYHRFIDHRLGKPPTYVNRSIGWSPQPIETPTLKGGKDERTPVSRQEGG